LDAWRMHRVGAGETLASIGKRYGVTPAAIASANRLEAAQTVEGDRLLIPSLQRVQPAMVKKPAVTASARRRSSRGRAVTTASVRTAKKPPVVVAHNTGN